MARTILSYLPVLPNISTTPSWYPVWAIAVNSLWTLAPLRVLSGSWALSRPLHLSGCNSYSIRVSTSATTSESEIGKSPGLVNEWKVAVWSTCPGELRDLEEKKLPQVFCVGGIIWQKPETKPNKNIFCILLALHENNCISNVSTAGSPEGPIINLYVSISTKVKEKVLPQNVIQRKSFTNFRVLLSSPLIFQSSFSQ